MRLGPALPILFNFRT